MACPICHEFEYNPNVTFRGGREPMDYFKVSEIEASAKTCSFCSALFSILDGHDHTRIPNLGIRNDTRDGTFKGIIFDIEGDSGYSLPYGRSPDGTPPHARYTLRNLSKISNVDAMRSCESGLVNTGSAPGVQWAQDKIRECRNNHSDCKQKTQGALPDRVLDIGPLVIRHTSNGEEIIEADMKLYETSGETLPYAALSHRWGNSQPLCLKLDSILEFRQGISWQALPKTFKQAAIFARKLGLQYIWIDSLCIIQDSKDDWLVQSGKMANIYENALITLAATASSGAASGCFVEPPLPLQGYIKHGTTKVPARDHATIQRLFADKNTVEPVIYIKALAHHNTPGHYIYEDLPLLKRGWVYQERLLSPRIVHFGTVDLIWECNHDLFCYCGFYVPQVIPGVTGNPMKPQHAACIRVDSQPSTSAAAMQWIHIIQSYTMLDLTFGSDRLPAIAGVAKQFRRGLKNKSYLAGLWEESLIVGLTWCRATRDNVWHQIWSSVIPLGPRSLSATAAPSWSWLSIPGPVTYLHPSDEWSEVDGPEVVNIASHQDGDTEFTRLQRGSITLRGRLIMCKQRRIQAEGREHDGVIRPGQKGFFKICRDYIPDEDEQWQEIIPRWAKDLTHKGQDSSQVHQLPANEDLDDEIPKYMSWAKTISAQQCIKEFYALFMGTRISSISSENTGLFLLLDRSYGPDRTYTRTGLGEYPADLSLFDMVEETQDVVLV